MKELIGNLWVFSILFLWSLFITPVSISISKRFRILDLPGGRKIHNSVVPYGGGLVLWTGYMMWSLFFSPQGPMIAYCGTGVTIVFLTGYLDDITPIRPIVRFGLHFFAAVLIIMPLAMTPLVKLILILWITGMTNAYNLIDGINGLCLMLFLASCCITTLWAPGSLWVPLIGLALGLLRWNFPRALTFLGDGGSTLLGFIFSSHLILSFTERIPQKNVFNLIFMLLLLGGIPAIDTLFAITRRSLNHGSPFLPDRGHLHHRLLDHGLSGISTVLTLTMIHGLFVTAGIVILLFTRVN